MQSSHAGTVLQKRETLLGTNWRHAIFRVLPAVGIKITVLWDVRPMVWYLSTKPSEMA
jgi:hypothetical protein